MADAATLDTIDNRSIDSTGKMRPAISADSSRPDLPVPDGDNTPSATESDTAGEDKGTDTVVEATTEETAAEPAGQNAEGEYVDAAGKKIPYEQLPPYVKREMTIARNKAKSEANRAAAEAAGRQQAMEALAAANRRIEALEAERAKPVEVVEALPKPKRDTFDSIEAYDVALVEWATGEARRIATQEAEEGQRKAEAKRASDDRAKAQEAADKANAEAHKAWMKQRESAMEEFPDYVEVAEDAAVQITPQMAQAIMAADNGTRIAYHLGKNPALADKISKLPPGRQVMEIGKLEDKLNAPAPKQISKAPPAITPIGARNSAAQKTAEQESMDEYAARRNKELRAGGMNRAIA